MVTLVGAFGHLYATGLSRFLLVQYSAFIGHDSLARAESDEAVRV